MQNFCANKIATVTRGFGRVRLQNLASLLRSGHNIHHTTSAHNVLVGFSATQTVYTMRGCMASRHHGMAEQLSGCATSRRRLQRSRAATGWIATTLLTVVAIIHIPQAAAQTQQQICTWDGKVCNLMINFAVQASRSSQKVIDLLPK